MRCRFQTKEAAHPTSAIGFCSDEKRAGIGVAGRARVVADDGLSEFSSGVSSGPLQQWGGFGMDLPLH